MLKKSIIFIIFLIEKNCFYRSFSLFLIIYHFSYINRSFYFKSLTKWLFYTLKRILLFHRTLFLWCYTYFFTYLRNCFMILSIQRIIFHLWMFSSIQNFLKEMFIVCHCRRILIKFLLNLLQVYFLNQMLFKLWKFSTWKRWTFHEHF